MGTAGMVIGIWALSHVALAVGVAGYSAYEMTIGRNKRNKIVTVRKISKIVKNS